MVKKTFKVPDMSCTNCAMKLESLEDTLEGVKEINASYTNDRGNYELLNML